jgi:hypothetical protein
MKNILRENMRRFGTKNLNEGPESEFTPFVAVEDITVKVTTKYPIKRSINTEQEVHGEKLKRILVKTTPGDYNVDKDVIEVMILGDDNGFTASAVVFDYGSPQKLVPKDATPGDIGWRNLSTSGGNACLITLPLKDIPLIKHKYFSVISLGVRGNTEKKPIGIGIDLGNSDLNWKRTPSITVGDVE